MRRRSWLLLAVAALIGTIVGATFLNTSTLDLLCDASGANGNSQYSLRVKKPILGRSTISWIGLNLIELNVVEISDVRIRANLLTRAPAVEWPEGADGVVIEINRLTGGVSVHFIHKPPPGSENKWDEVSKQSGVCKKTNSPF